MVVSDTEQFIRDAARLGWSRNEVCEVLGISWFSLSAILDAIGPLPWVPGTQSLARKRDAENRRGYCPPALQRASQAAVAIRRKRAEHEVFGVRGTIKELAKLFGMSATTVRRRLRDGLSLEAALTIPAIPCHLRRAIKPGQLEIPAVLPSFCDH